MKKTMEIVYGNSLKINRGNYEQEAPLYSAKSIIEVNGEAFDEKAEYTRLRQIVDPLLTEHWEKAKLDLSGLRIRIKDGKRYVSVTSILNHDKDFSEIDPEYAIRGKEFHRLVNQAIRNKKWEAPKVPLLRLKYEDIKYKEFFIAHKSRLNFEGAQLEVEVFNDDHLYSGEVDLICLVDDVKTIVDLKTGSWDWKQLIAYWKCSVDFPQVAIFDLKLGKLEILDPFSSKANEHWEKFLIKRGEVKARFAV